MDSATSRSKILIVDDIPDNINVLVHALKDDYRLAVATSGKGALQLLRKHAVDLILLDVMMPEMDGFETCERIKANEETRQLPIIFVTAAGEILDKSRGFELGGVDYIVKPFDLIELKARVRTHLALKHAQEALQRQNEILEEKVEERTLELRQTQLEIVDRLARAAEFRDGGTGLHVRRLSHYCLLLGRSSGLSEAECKVLFHASRMHDVGKVGIPDGILLKRGRLDPKEWAIMQTHTTIGAKILAHNGCKLLSMAESIALTHHEKWDGSGYPQGLEGAAIPFVGRITSICDVFDALTSLRPYKEPWPVEEAVSEIIRGSGTHFEPALVEKFVEILPQLLAVKQQFSSLPGDLEDSLWEEDLIQTRRVLL